MDVTKPTVKLKTMTYNIKDNNIIKIFNEMTNWSKNVYNSAIYCYSIYKLYKNDIYYELYEYIKNLEEYKQLVEYLKNNCYVEDIKKEKENITN